MPYPQTGGAGVRWEAGPFKSPSSSPIMRPGAQVNSYLRLHRLGQVPEQFGFTEGKGNCSVWAPHPTPTFPAKSRMLFLQTPRRAQPAHSSGTLSTPQWESSPPRTAGPQAQGLNFRTQFFQTQEA